MIIQPLGEAELRAKPCWEQWALEAKIVLGTTLSNYDCDCFHFEYTNQYGIIMLSNTVQLFVIESFCDDKLLMLKGHENIFA